MYAKIVCIDMIEYNVDDIVNKVKVVKNLVCSIEIFMNCFSISK